MITISRKCGIDVVRIVVVPYGDTTNLKSCCIRYRLTFLKRRIQTLSSSRGPSCSSNVFGPSGDALFIARWLIDVTTFMQKTSFCGFARISRRSDILGRCVKNNERLIDDSRMRLHFAVLFSRLDRMLLDFSYVYAFSSHHCSPCAQKW